MDGPVTALTALSILADSLEDALLLEDRWAEQSLRKGHQPAAWAASFFNRAFDVAKAIAGQNSCDRCMVSPRS